MAKSKELGINMIEMFCKMIDDEFKPVISILKSRTDGIEGIVKKQVKKDWGIYDMVARKAALNEQIKELDEQIKKKMKEECVYEGGRHEWTSAIDIEVKKRLAELNEPLARTQAQAESLKRQIRLSSATSEVKVVFDGIADEIKKLTEEAKSLPPIERLMGITGKEMKKLQSLAE